MWYLLIPIVLGYGNSDREICKEETIGIRIGYQIRY